MKKRLTAQKITYIAVIAALYTALSLALAPIAFGQIQCRIAEALTILPIFNPLAIVGLALGCAITNLAGVAMGANILGAADIAIGTAATLLAAICTYFLRRARWGKLKLPVLAAIPPILFNALIIGGELYFAFGEFAFWICVGQVALGQVAACMILGLPLAIALEKTGFANKLRAI